MEINFISPRIQTVNLNYNHPLSNQIDILRLDEIHPEISGNKWYKLKYVIQYCLNQQVKGIITFGGAHSNHLAACAFAGKTYDIKTIGIVRGEKTTFESPTLQFAQAQDMELFFVNRSDYTKSHEQILPKLLPEFQKYLIVPEGGNSDLGRKGTREILSENTKNYDIIICPVGTGNTLAGLISNAAPHQQLIGISALKGKDLFTQKIQQQLQQDHIHHHNWEINFEYHLGGYAKYHKAIPQIIHEYQQTQNIPLDPIYTAKMMYAVKDLIIQRKWQNKKILCIHTGGLQGTKAYYKRYNIQQK